MQDVALVEVHAIVAEPPLPIVLGATARAAVGTTLTVALAAALPPAPVQLKEYVAEALSGPVD